MNPEIRGMADGRGPEEVELCKTMVGFEGRLRTGKRLVTDASVSNKLDVIVWSQRRGFLDNIDEGLWRGVEALFDRDKGCISTQEETTKVRM